MMDSFVAGEWGVIGTVGGRWRTLQLQSGLPYESLFARKSVPGQICALRFGVGTATGLRFDGVQWSESRILPIFGLDRC